MVWLEPRLKLGLFAGVLHTRRTQAQSQEFTEYIVPPVSSTDRESKMYHNGARNVSQTTTNR